MNTSTATAPAPSAAPTERDYTVGDLAERLQCSPRHLWRLLDAGKLPGVIRLGRLVRLHRATIEAWLLDGAPSMRRPK